MSRLDPPQVLIEASALAALADPDHHQHTAVAAAYRTLLARHRRNEVLLVAVSRHLRPLEVAPTDPWQTQLRWAVARPHPGLFAAALMVSQAPRPLRALQSHAWRPR